LCFMFRRAPRLVSVSVLLTALILWIPASTVYAVTILWLTGKPP
jgi:hypothetical protein